MRITRPLTRPAATLSPEYLGEGERHTGKASGTRFWGLAALDHQPPGTREFMVRNSGPYGTQTNTPKDLQQDGMGWSLVGPKPLVQALFQLIKRR